MLRDPTTFLGGRHASVQVTDEETEAQMWARSFTQARAPSLNTLFKVVSSGRILLCALPCIIFFQSTNLYLVCLNGYHTTLHGVPLYYLIFVACVSPAL